MASLKVTAEAVPLPAGPVDFDALSAALKAGKSGEKAIELAVKDNPVPETVEATPAPEPVEVAEVEEAVATEPEITAPAATEKE